MTKFVTGLLVAAAAAALCVSCSQSNGNVTVTGTVTDENTGQPISGAMVSDSSTGRGGVTDALGLYSFVTHGETIKITASASGYSDGAQMITPAPDNKAFVLNFSLATHK